MIAIGLSIHHVGWGFAAGVVVKAMHHLPYCICFRASRESKRVDVSRVGMPLNTARNVLRQSNTAPATHRSLFVASNMIISTQVFIGLSVSGMCKRHCAIAFSEVGVVTAIPARKAVA